MPRLVRAYAAQVRLQAALNALIDAVEQHGEALFITRSQRAADDALRLAEFPQSGLLGIHRRTLTGLAADLSALPLAKRSMTRVSAVGARALVARSVSTVRQQAPLSYFEPVAGTPGFAVSLNRTLAALRLAGVGAEQLRGLGDKGLDLARLMKAYALQLQTYQLADRAAVLEVATEVARSGQHPLLGHPLVLLDDAPGNPLERALLEALCSQAPSIFAATHRKDERSQQHLQSVINEAAADLPEPDPQSSLQRAQAFVFEPEAPQPQPLDSTVVFFSAPGESRECVEIARKIQTLCRQGARWDSMAILLRDTKTYQPLVESALARAGIEGFFSAGTQRAHPAGRALLTLLHCASEGLSAARFAEYLSLGQVPAHRHSDAAGDDTWVPPSPTDDSVPAPQGPPSQPPRHLKAPLQWEKILMDAAVIGDPARWHRRLAGWAYELRRRAEAAGNLEPTDDERALASLREFALPVIDALYALPEEATWGIWQRHLEALVSQTLAEPMPVRALLAQLSPMQPVGPVSLQEVQGVLQQYLSQLNITPAGPRYGKVFVGSLDDAAARSFDIVFVPGLAEGLFPRRPREDPLLLDAARVALDAELETLEDSVQQERLRLHRALGAASQQVVLSYPRVDVAQGRPRVPSFYALDLLRAALGKVPEPHTLKQEAAHRTRARLGWPAPQVPAQAIDHAEFDLATLALRLSAPNEVQGHGHYLIQAADKDPAAAILVRNLRAQAARWRKPWSRHDGLVARPDRSDPDGHRALPLLEDFAPLKRAVSPAALQSFAVCPYRFYLQSILQLQPHGSPAPMQAIDQRTRAELYRQAQTELLHTLLEAGLLPLQDAQIDEALSHLHAVLDRQLPAAKEALAPAIEAVWQRDVQLLTYDLRGWLRDMAQGQSAWTPHSVDLSFGHETAPVKLFEGFRVKGAVDLLEQKDPQGSLRATNYSCSQAPQPSPEYVGGGTHLQPLISAMAAEAVLQQNNSLGRTYYSTHRGGFRVVEVPADETAKKHLRSVFTAVQAAVEDGFFPAAPRKGACEHCEYRRACGPQEGHRSTRKDQDRLQSLFSLRQLP